jgi:nucleoside-diphosphate-sugar epimerase
MADNLVLITGATGHLGFKVLRTALEAGYHVRAAVRSDQKATLLKSNHVLKTTPGFSNLSFIVVPDFLAPGAFDEAVKDTKSIIHVASPIVTKLPENDDYDAHFVQPAVQGTLGVFESAQKAGTVTRIVITSSAVAILPLLAMTQSDGNSYDADNRLPEIPPPFADIRVAYVASKIAALSRAEAWIAEQKPAFDVIHIHPSFIFGRDDLADSTAYFQTGTNRLPLNIALGVESEAQPNTWNDVGDTAKMHVMALDEGRVPGNQSFLASSTGQDGMRYVASSSFQEDGYQGELLTWMIPLGSIKSKILSLATSLKLWNAETCRTMAARPTFSRLWTPARPRRRLV